MMSGHPSHEMLKSKTCLFISFYGIVLIWWESQDPRVDVLTNICSIKYILTAKGICFASLSEYIPRQHTNIVQLANIGIILAKHHHTSIGPTKVQHQTTLAGQCQPNIGKPTLDQQSFVQWAYYVTDVGWPSSKVQHQISLVCQCQPKLARKCWASRDLSRWPILAQFKWWRKLRTCFFNILLIDFSSVSVFFFVVQMTTMRLKRK